MIAKKKCIFYLHNLFEDNHYAIKSAVSKLMECGISYQFMAKRIINNDTYSKINIKNAKLLSEVNLSEPSWKEFDMVHVIYDGKPSLAICSVCDIYDIPYVITFHGGYDTNKKIFLDSVRDKTSHLCNRARFVTVVSNRDKKSLIKIGVNEEKIKLTPPPIDRGVLPKISSSKNKKRITVVGRFVEKKGIDIAIKGLKQLPDDYYLDIVGDGELKNQLQELAKECNLDNRITWHGQLSIVDTLNIINNNAILWHSARVASNGNAEGTPQVLIYAMALKTLVITTDCGGINNLIKSKYNGILIQENDYLNLAKETLLSQEIDEQCKKNAYLEAENYFIENQLKAWCEIYGI